MAETATDEKARERERGERKVEYNSYNSSAISNIIAGVAKCIDRKEKKYTATFRFLFFYSAREQIMLSDFRCIELQSDGLQSFALSSVYAPHEITPEKKAQGSDYIAYAIQVRHALQPKTIT